MAQKDFIKRTEEFAAEQWDTEDKRLYQTRHDYLAGVEYGYQYAVDKYERLIKELLEQDISSGYANSFIDDLRKAVKK